MSPALRLCQPQGSSSSDDSSDSESSEERPPDLRAGWDYVRVTGGFIVYDAAPTRHINAHCTNKAHGPSCHFNKVSYGNPRRGREGQGRPLGALALWLFAGDCETKAEHAEWKAIVCAREAKPEREFHRQNLHEQPHCAKLFENRERPKMDHRF